MWKKVFVSGCFDLLHSGHVAFFKEAAELGEVFVSIGSDQTIFKLKNRASVNVELERLFMVKSIKYVTDAWIGSGENEQLDFEPELVKLKPDIFFVNKDGDSELKRLLCKKMGIEYIVGNRIPFLDLPIRSTTALRNQFQIPYRIDLAGAWMDLPEVSNLHSGSIINIPIQPDFEFNERSGMATSTRKKAIKMWGQKIPDGNREDLAHMLFAYENEPGSAVLSGSHDALGILMPGLNNLLYEGGNYWPTKIKTISDETVLTWLEQHLFLYPLHPRIPSFDVLADTQITEQNAKGLSEASALCWKALLNKDLKEIGKHVTTSFKAQIKMFPNMTNSFIESVLTKFKKKALGWKLSGAGGGGYIIFIAERKFSEDLIEIKIVR